MRLWKKTTGSLFLLDRVQLQRLIPVETGQFNWNFIEITSGVKEGDTVIINPDATGLADGKRVREKKKAE